MTDKFNIDTDVSLWDCVHDGSLERLVSNPLARTITLAIDVPYLWEFHKMTESTRFVIELQEVRKIEAFTFAAWPGASVNTPMMSWEESEKRRQSDHEKGRYESLDWSSLEAVLQTTNSYEFSDGTLYSADENLVLSLDLRNFDSEEYRTVEIAANSISYKLGHTQDLSLQEFLSLGEAYWRAFAERSAQLQAKD